jgi:AsmA protein
MNRKYLLLGAVALSFAVGAGLKPWRIDASEARRELAPRLLAGTGFSPTSLNAVTFTALPYPRIQVGNAEFTDPARGRTISAAGLSGTVRLLPLVGGRLELADLSLIEPHLAIPESVVADPLGAAASALLPDLAEASPTLSRVVVVNGTVDLIGASGTTSRALDDVNAVLRRAPGDPSTGVSLAARWKGESFELTLSAFDPGRFVAALPSAIDASLVTGMGRLQFQGKLGRSGWGGQAEGVLTADISALPEFVAWLGEGLPLRAGNKLKGRADLRASPAGLSLENSHFALDGRSFDGVASLRRSEDGKTSLSGTLATDQVDLTPALHSLNAPRASETAWSREPFDLSVVPSGDVDLRLSVARLVLGRSVVTNAALALIGHPGRADITLGTADFQRGTVRGRFSAAASGRNVVEARGQLVFERIETGALLSDDATRRVSGLASGSVSMEGSGESPVALMRSLEGKIAVAMRQGEITGVNLPEILRRMERRTLVSALDARGGRTPFESAGLTGRISRGIVEISDATIASPAARVSLNGQINLGERSLALAGTAQPTDPGAAAAVSLPFEVSGSFDEPVFAPDARSILRRSGAAAPLLEPGGPGRSAMPVADAVSR